MWSNQVTIFFPINNDLCTKESQIRSQQIENFLKLHLFKSLMILIRSLTLFVATMLSVVPLFKMWLYRIMVSWLWNCFKHRLSSALRATLMGETMASMPSNRPTSLSPKMTSCLYLSKYFWQISISKISKKLCF